MYQTVWGPSLGVKVQYTYMYIYIYRYMKYDLNTLEHTFFLPINQYNENTITIKKNYSQGRIFL